MGKFRKKWNVDLATLCSTHGEILNELYFKKCQLIARTYLLIFFIVGEHFFEP
jgi:hypothetical protein